MRRLLRPVLCSVTLVFAAACGVGGGSDSASAGMGDGDVRGSGDDGAAAPGLSTGAPSGRTDEASGDGTGGTGTTPAVPGEEPASSAGGSADEPPSEPDDDEPEPAPPPARAGIITAGAWDDNRNFERFLGYRSGLETTQLAGLLPISEAELKSAHERWKQAPSARQRLDISLVIDTTGSMGDEISYLQAEFDELSSTIEEQYPDSEQRWSLVVYRDEGDEYVSRWFDFRDDTAEFRAHLAAQSANGGGDFPEAPEAGFAALEQLAWRSDDSTARLAFWVADAPHHAERKGALAESLRRMQSLGVHVYPVASSGVDELTELSMRTAAALTGGRYLFLTNDSGVGDDHKEPTIPCYFVTSLSDAMLRMVGIELSGKYREPARSEIIRTGGNPQDGACKLASGQSVLVF